MSAVVKFAASEPHMPTERGQPPWNIALLYPPQGSWTEEAYLALPTNRLVELVEGFLEVLPMPSPLHMAIVALLYDLLAAWVRPRQLGKVLFAPLPVRLFDLTFREPDVMFFRAGRLRDPHQAPQGVDLAMEVVSPGATNRQRDLVAKRAEYARARVAEYWIVDPENEQITVLTLDGDDYRVHGEFTRGSLASSVLLPGFAVDVATVFAADLGPDAPTA